MPWWVYLCLVVAGLVVVCYFLVRYVLNLALASWVPKTMVLGDNTVPESERAERMQKDDTEWLAKRGFVEVTQEAWDGVVLFGRILPAEDPSSHLWAVVIHGYGGNGLHEGTPARHFHDKGYNVFLPDLRGFGNSGGEYIGMGWLDARDIMGWLAQLEMIDPDGRIALYGGSMGGATVMMTTGWPMPDNVLVAVEDCGYTSVWDEFEYQMRKLFHLPHWPLLDWASSMAKRRAGYSFKEASSLRQLANSTTPTLFIQGTKDQFVPSWMLEKNFAACPAAKQKLYVEGATHNRSMYKDPDLYWATVDGFVDPRMEPVARQGGEAA